MNPSSVVALELDGSTIDGRPVIGVELPVTAAGAPLALEAAIEIHRPEIVLSLGLAEGRSKLALERVAINVLDFSTPDNAGDTPVDVPVVEGEPAAYFSTLPIKAILASWQQESLPGYVSNTAGTYVCNQVLYKALSMG